MIIIDTMFMGYIIIRPVGSQAHCCHRYPT